jgi:hypothetical protein
MTRDRSAGPLADRCEYPFFGLSHKVLTEED